MWGPPGDEGHAAATTPRGEEGAVPARRPPAAQIRISPGPRPRWTKMASSPGSTRMWASGPLGRSPRRGCPRVEPLAHLRTQENWPRPFRLVSGRREAAGRARRAMSGSVRATSRRAPSAGVFGRQDDDRPAGLKLARPARASAKATRRVSARSPRGRHVVARLHREHGHRRLRGPEAAGDVQRLPGTRRLVLGEAERILPRPALGRLVEHTRVAAEGVQQHESERPADGGVGADPRAEEVPAPCRPIAARTGPLTITMSAAPPGARRRTWSVNSGSPIAASAAPTTGKYSGRQRP